MPLALATYLLASVAVGTAQVADAVALVKFKGRLGAVTTVFSIVEYVWAAVSFFVWRAAGDSVPYWLPALFIALRRCVLRCRPYTCCSKPWQGNASANASRCSWRSLWHL